MSNERYVQEITTTITIGNEDAKEVYEGRVKVSNGIRVVPYDRYPDEYWECYIATDEGLVGGGYALTDEEVGKRLRQLSAIVPITGSHPFIALTQDNRFVGAVNPKTADYVIFSEGVG